MIQLTSTEDGSLTLFNDEIGEHYHSKHGAFQESKHVFINAGLKELIEGEQKKDIHVFEMGFGTGLNFLLSYDLIELSNCSINYVGLEAFPLTGETLESTQYKQFVSANIWETFIAAYPNALKGEEVKLSDRCSLSIVRNSLQNYQTDKQFDLVYFDAFSVRHQPELWSAEIIDKVCGFMRSEAVFVTYAITGNLKRALQSAGCVVEKLPGAPGKREMLRARKN
jgi:tRNA U34 5-methylaminomethyl-2-thiouridine-forming methyltransferase MnmC